LEQERLKVAVIKRQRLEGTLVPVEELREDLSAMVRHLRRFGEQAFARWGADCLDCYNESLDDMARIVLNMSPCEQGNRYSDAGV
jgi:hypothetical protein